MLHYITMLAAGGGCSLIWELGWKGVEAWEKGHQLAWEKAGAMTSLQTWRHLQGMVAGAGTSVGPLTGTLVWWNGSSTALDTPLHENPLSGDAGFGGTSQMMTHPHCLRPLVW